MNQGISVLVPRRVTVVAPHTRVDVSLPAQATLAEVAQELAPLVGLDTEDDRGMAVSWSLTTLLGDRLEPDRSVVASGLRDGDVLYLRSADRALPPPVYDDVVDAVATTTRVARMQWGPDATRTAVLLGGLAVLLGGLALLLAAGPPWEALVRAGAVVTVVLLVATWLLARSMDQRGLARWTAGAAWCWAVTAASVAALADAPVTGIGARSLLAGGTAAVVVSAVCLGVLGARWYPAGGAGVVGALAAAGAAATMLFGVPLARTAAVLGCVLLLVQPALPALAMRWARLPQPPVPRDTSTFRAVNRPDWSVSVESQTVGARQALTALLAAVSVVVAACGSVLSSEPDLDGSAWMPWLAAALAGGLALRTRHTVHTGPRAVMLGAAAVSGAGALTALADGLDRSVLGALVTAVTVGVVLVLLLVVRTPPREPSPYRGRALDVAEMLVLAALPLLCLGALDVYALVRGIGG
ncbi:MAG: type VII secretion integral membrane protein EccD [Dermatophilaceae bacterium]